MHTHTYIHTYRPFPLEHVRDLALLLLRHGRDSGRAATPPYNNNNDYDNNIHE